jgi:hypothetical protein
MSDYNWCHGPNCHTYQTQDRVRGVKGNKVLRTRKIKITQWNQNGPWQYFCSRDVGLISFQGMQTNVETLRLDTRR